MLTMYGHSDRITSVCLSNSGKICLSASADCSLRLWDAQKGTELQVLAAHSDSVNAVAMTPDAKRAISASSDRSLKLWDLTSGTNTHTLYGHTDRVLAVAFSTNGTMAVSGGADASIIVWDAVKAMKRHSLFGHKRPIVYVALNRDSKQALTGADDGTLIVFNIDAQTPLLQLNPDRSNPKSPLTTPLCVSSGLLLLACGHRCSVVDLHSCQAVASFYVDANVTVGIVSEQEPEVMIGDASGVLHLLKLSTPQPRKPAVDPMSLPGVADVSTARPNSKLAMPVVAAPATNKKDGCIVQ
eukprot:TRINITY_DN4836_c0_g1_i2.p1 TRINITY_DN4836_c0_g1~~TRINITY_DN4836_c0_g1_i2.p1  ORF type:complete len:298 (+),score=63.39 TRINITY_DN4836_c0_g1_i2:1436-2329(+)